MKIGVVRSVQSAYFQPSFKPAKNEYCAMYAASVLAVSEGLVV